MVNIRTYIDDDTGIAAYKIGNWNGVALEFTKDGIAQVENSQYRHHSGVYLLIGPGGESLFDVYIGEADDLFERVKQHESKQFWQRAIMFTTYDNSLDKGYTLYLEHLLIKEFIDLAYVNLQNRNIPKKKSMDDYRRKEIIEFYNKILLILEHRGFIRHFDLVEPREKEEKYDGETKQITITLGGTQSADEPAWRKHTLIPVQKAIWVFFLFLLLLFSFPKHEMS